MGPGGLDVNRLQPLCCPPENDDSLETLSRVGAVRAGHLRECHACHPRLTAAVMSTQVDSARRKVRASGELRGGTRHGHLLPVARTGGLWSAPSTTGCRSAGGRPRASTFQKRRTSRLGEGPYRSALRNGRALHSCRANRGRWWASAQGSTSPRPRRTRTPSVSRRRRGGLPSSPCPSRIPLRRRRDRPAKPPYCPAASRCE